MALSLGMIELNSIAHGVDVADTMIKTAEVELVASKPVCPGKYVVIVSGRVDAVQAATDAGRARGAEYVVDHLLIANLDGQVVAAINASTDVGDIKALGVMEFFSVAASVAAADTAVKTADVRLIEVRLGIGVGGKSFVTLTGDVAAVNEAVRSGVARAAEEGMLVGKCVIPSPRREIFQALL